MKKPTISLRQTGKRIGGGIMGSLMLFSGTIMPYQGITLTNPLIGNAAETAAEPNKYVPYAEVTKPAVTSTTSTPVTATTSSAATTAKATTTTTKSAATTKLSATTTTQAVTASTNSTVNTQTSASSDADGFDFSVYPDHAVLEKYTGNAAAVKIPATYQGVPVTMIYNEAFQNNKTLKSVELPASITEIGSEAFANCTALEKVSIPEGLETLGYCAFNNTALTEIYIPASLQSANQPFDNCASLNKVTFGKGITKIPNELFQYCSGLTEITIPETVTEIGSNAFDNCKSLKKVVLTEGLETLEYRAFDNAELTEIYIPASLQSANQPFTNCQSLNKVTFGKGITKIPNELFQNCSGLTEITIPETVTEIGSEAFDYCKSLKKAVLTEGLETLGYHAFYNTALTEIYIPGTVTEIGVEAFNNCKSLKKVELSEGLESLGYCAFNNTALTEIYIPASLQSANQPFTNCQSLNKVTFGEGITKIPDELFQYCSALTEITVPGTVMEIGTEAFDNCKSLKKVELSEGLETLGYCAFNNTALTEIYIPASLITADQPFDNCASLTKVTFGEGITKIPNELFQHCISLTEITIPDTVTEIGTNAFDNCSSLKKVELPEGLKKLGYCAFDNTALTEIYIPASLTTADQPFDNCASLNKVTFGKGITKIPNELFQYCSSLTEITIPETVTEIGTNAFEYCNSLKKVVLQEGLETLGYGAFDNTALTEIYIPATLKNADQPFSHCRSLKKITFGEGITTIPNELFQYCYGLTEITIPETVTEIGTNAFEYCNSLKKVVLQEGLETLGYDAFNNTALTEIRIPSSLKSANHPFYNCKSLEYAEIAEGMVRVPDHLFDHASALKKVRLAGTTQSLGAYAFSDCNQLTAIEPQDIQPTFTNTTFYHCNELYDTRFCLVDRRASGMTVNSTVGSVNGLVHFTVKYKIDERTTNLNLHLNLPEQLAIVPDSITCTDAQMKMSNDLDSVVLQDHTGTLRFSARVLETGYATVSAKVSFSFDQAKWEELIDEIEVEAPALTVNAPDTVNELSALVYGIAGKQQKVTIYVDNDPVTTITSDATTGKYRVRVPLPERKDGTVYEIGAETDSAKIKGVSVVYRKSAPTVQSVMLYYNGHSDTGKDITAVLTEGQSPVISFNPSYPMQFAVKTDNTKQIDRLFVTSTKGPEVKYMEAFYDAEQDTWLTKMTYFDPNNHSYIPGALNISILEKQPEPVVDVKNPEDYNAAMHLPDSTPQAYRDNSTLNVLEQTDQAFAAEVNFTDGTEDHKFVYYSERNDKVVLNGESVTAEEIAKDPAKYGYQKVPASAVNGDERYSYYLRWDTEGYLLDGLLIDTFAQYVNGYTGIYTGYSLLEIAEGDNSDSLTACFVNNLAVAELQTCFDELTGGLYGTYGSFLKLFGDSANLVSRMYHAGDNEAQQVAAIMLFAAQVIVDSGGLELMLVTCGVAAPVAMLVTVGACVLLYYAGDWLDEWIAGNSFFSSGGLIRFICDPSGIVYEAVLSNPVSGAEVKIYYLDPESGKQTEWNAADYEQENPWITDTDGTYAWDVPEGKWKVVCTKDGYDSAESDWLPVPPVQTDIHLALVSHDVPAVSETKISDNTLTITFSKYMADASVSKDSVQLWQGDKQIAGTVKPVKEEGNQSEFSVTYQISADEQVNWNTAKLKTTAAAKSYADVPATVTAYTLAADTLLGDINGDSVISVEDAQLTLIEYVNAMTGLKSSFTENQKIAGDINGDKEISVEDAQIILIYYVSNTISGQNVTWDELLGK